MSMTINSIASISMQKSSLQLSTGKKINSAADDAAGLAIAEKLQAQIQGLDQGSENTADMKNLVNTAEGSLGGINDSLQRVRELSLQASNSGVLTDNDKQLIQNEVSQLLQGISDMAGNAQYNKMNLLDGSFANKNTASGPDGTGAQVSIGDMSLESLGLADFDVTKDFDISQIDAALEKVNSSRSELGALTNRFDYTMNSNAISELNIAASKSRIADADMAKASMAYNKDKLMVDYQILMQKQKMDDAKTKFSAIF